MIKDFRAQLNEIYCDGVPAVITVSHWTMGPTGETFLHFWAHKWRILTDKSVPLENFHSSEKWQLVGLDNLNKIKIIIPGCQIHGMSICKEAPKVSNCLKI